MAAVNGVVVRMTAETKKVGWSASVRGMGTTLSDGDKARSVR